MRLREQGRGEGCGCIEGPERLAVAAEAALAIAAAHITHVTRYATVEFNGPDAERVKRVLQRDVTENQMRHDQLWGIRTVHDGSRGAAYSVLDQPEGTRMKLLPEALGETQ